MTINWEPSEFDRAFVVSGTLSVTKSSGHRTLGYPKPVSVSADNRRDAKAKVRAMLVASTEPSMISTAPRSQPLSLLRRSGTPRQFRAPSLLCP